MSMLGSLFDSFTGKSARADIDKGIGAVQGNTGKAIAAITDYGGRARGEFDPYVQGGHASYDLGLDTLGVHGADARSSAESLYNTDDFLAKQRDLDLKRSGWKTNAAGFGAATPGSMPGSGVAALADSRTRLAGYGDWQNKLLALGQQGQAAAGSAAGVEQNTGAEIGNAYGTEGNSLASLYGNRANSENTFAQNLIGLGGLAVSAYTGMPTRRPGGGAGGGVNNIS